MPRRRSIRSPFTIVLVATLIVLLVALGVWQLQRLAWKTSLIARVNARVHAPAQPAPVPKDWATINAASDEYRHVVVRGHFLNTDESQVYTLTDFGAGYWIMTPLVADNGMIVYVNRGFVGMDQRDPARRIGGPVGESEVTGLLRIPEIKGWLFSQANDPAHDTWYRRDIAAMALKHRLGPVAPYFIDADATPNPGGWPKGGLTKVQFPNSHLVYALTWFCLAAMLASVSIWLTWFQKDDDTNA